jgi:predicted GIY-YIG superfamily endonuclease
MARQRGTIYLICFDRPFRHARHYLGWTTDLERRIKQHREINLDNLVKAQCDRGAVLMAHVNSAGIGWRVARTWENETRKLESVIKRGGYQARSCPECRKRYNETQQKRRARKQKEKAMSERNDQQNETTVSEPPRIDPECSWLGMPSYADLGFYLPAVNRLLANGHELALIGYEFFA